MSNYCCPSSHQSIPQQLPDKDRWGSGSRKRKPKTRTYVAGSCFSCSVFLCDILVFFYLLFQSRIYHRERSKRKHHRVHHLPWNELFSSQFDPSDQSTWSFIFVLLKCFLHISHYSVLKSKFRSLINSSQD